MKQSELAPQLPLALQNVSSDFLIGFGTFVDKPSLPYTSSVQLNKRFGDVSCIKPFNYEHVISLTNSSDANIVPVFAVADSSSSSILIFYNNTISMLLDSSTVLLSSNSDNLVEVLREAYANKIANAHLSFNNFNYLSANVTVNCPPGSSCLPDSNECTGIGNGTVNFTITLTLLKCTESLRNGKSANTIYSLTIWTICG